MKSRSGWVGRTSGLRWRPRTWKVALTLAMLLGVVALLVGKGIATHPQPPCPTCVRAAFRGPVPDGAGREGIARQPQSPCPGCVRATFRDPVTGSSTTSLKLLTYNLALPALIATSARHYRRAGEMAELVRGRHADTDVLGTQEDQSAASDRFFDNLNNDGGHFRTPIRHMPPRQGGPAARGLATALRAGLAETYRTNGGVGITLRGHAVATTGAEAWTDCAGADRFWDVALPPHDADCLAQKGVVFARLRLGSDDTVPPLYVNIFVVHLDAFDDEASRAARAANLDQLRRFVEANSGSDPTIVMGDFNIRGSCQGCRNVFEEDLVPRLSSPTLGVPKDVYLDDVCGSLPGGSCPAGLDADSRSGVTFPEGAARLDYILYYPSMPAAGRPWQPRYLPGSFAIDQMVYPGDCFDCGEGGSGPLSDHFAVTARFEFWRPSRSPSR
jgi:hypothetical protein